MKELADNERRTYDLQISELKHEVNDLKEEVSGLRKDIKDLIDAWNTAKGVTAFVKWLAATVLAIGVILAGLKGITK